MGIRRAWGWLRALSVIGLLAVLVDAIPLLGSGWTVGLVIECFDPAALGAPWPEFSWGCSRTPSGPWELRQLHLLVVLGQSLWAVAVVGAASVLGQLLAALALGFRSSAASVYLSSTCLGLLSYGALMAVLLVVTSQPSSAPSPAQAARQRAQDSGTSCRLTSSTWSTGSELATIARSSR